MPIIKQEEWDKLVEKNSDPYGKCCVDVARRAMEILDNDSSPLQEGYFPDVHTTHGIICQADHDVKAGGITGFMAGCVASMIWQVHSRGDEFRKQYNADHGVDEEKAKGRIVNPAIMTIEPKDS